jgi:hypothetical protein
MNQPGGGRADRALAGGGLPKWQLPPDFWSACDLSLLSSFFDRLRAQQEIAILEHEHLADAYVARLTRRVIGPRVLGKRLAEHQRSPLAHDSHFVDRIDQSGPGKAVHF